jgi:threonine dehydrogenase-like Zn-dependent dehydrogenase
MPQQNALVWEGGTVVAVRPVAMRTDIEAAIELITAGKVDARRLISKIFLLDHAVSAIESLRRGEGMKVLISLWPVASEVINDGHR